MLILAALLSLQDEAIEAHVKALSHEDVAVREKATAELLKTPLAKLPVLEKHLKGPDAEACARVRRIMTQVLASNLGSRKPRFELRAMAGRKVMEEWIAGGADHKKPPEGHEACGYHPKAVNPGDDDPLFKREWVLVEPPCVSQEDVKSARLEVGIDRGYWQVDFELTPEGAKKFDKAAAVLFKSSPRGKLGILLDGKILSAPLVNAERFDGKGTIQGEFTEEFTRDMVKVMMGEWLESSMRAEREKVGAASPEKTTEFIRGVKGMGKVTLQADASGLDIAGFVDVKEVDLLALWQALRERGYRLGPKK